MNLEKLVLGVALLAGCTEYEVVRKPYVKGKLKQPVFEEVTTKIREGYFPLRLDQGEYEIYDLTFFKPKENYNPEPQLARIQELFKSYNFKLSDAKKALNKNILQKRTIIISMPQYDAVQTLEKSLSTENTNNATIDRCVAMCNVYPVQSWGLFSQSGYGNFIGANYILVPASVVYSTLIEKELGKETEIEFSRIIEQKRVGSAFINKARILAIDPIRDLALLERKEKFDSSLCIPIIQEKELEEAKIYTSRALVNMENYFKLTFEQMVWRTNEKELNLSKALAYGLISANTPTLFGCGIYNDKGLIGIIAHSFKDYPGFEEDSQNSLVIPGSQIREFLTDYLNFLKSGSKNLETILIDAQKTSITEQTTFTPTTVPLSQETTPESSEVPISPQEPIEVPWGKFILGSIVTILGAGIVGRFFYNPKEPKPRPDLSNIDQRLSELEKWLAPYKIDLQTIKETKLISEEITIPKTSIDSGQDQQTVTGFDAMGNSEEDKKLFKFKNKLEKQYKELEWLKKINDEEKRKKSFEDYLEWRKQLGLNAEIDPKFKELFFKDTYLSENIKNRITKILIDI